MLFIFDSAATQNFWMKDMLFPLDIAFISANGRIVDINRHFKPCTPDECPSYAAIAPAQYVLEVNAGLLDSVPIGTKVTFSNIG